MKKQSEALKKGEILQAINTFSDHVEERFGAIDKRFDQVDKRFEGVDKRFDVLESRLGAVENRLETVETGLGKVGTSMVTKDYLDEKLFDFKGDMIQMIRKEDYKLGVLVKILDDKKVISKKDSHLLTSLEPFPKK